MDYAKNLLVELLTNTSKYFDKRLVLNSDGRKLLDKIIYILSTNNFQNRKLLKSVRKEPTLENVIKLAEEVLQLDAKTLLQFKTNLDELRCYEEKCCD
ncbi:hypothetical protein QPL79_07065 [Ignisphaera sp. 4213-co]|uniref:Uncharacterized protein n=1 Tax=Ignisphaera cupida TaxID=3050454 RepID=A0ABD4Z8T1_9CREN|nr:hypothetical protein [Ignisphaera sp. 4213-co]MDK6029119.1 hypothetical protein [Ignisphaera sp. 4213-co]